MAQEGYANSLRELDLFRLYISLATVELESVNWTEELDRHVKNLEKARSVRMLGQYYAQEECK